MTEWNRHRESVMTQFIWALSISFVLAGLGAWGFRGCEMEEREEKYRLDAITSCIEKTQKPFECKAALEKRRGAQ